MNSNNKTHKSGFSLSHSNYTVTALLVFALFTLQIRTQYAQIAPDWYKNAQMPHIDSREKFYDLFKQPKHVFVEFFSPQCRYCALFLDDFNKLYHHLIDTYGEEQVAVYTLNGWEFQDIVQQVRVPYYPFFVYIAPNNEAPVEGQQKFMISGVFQEDRTYDIMLNWMLTMASGMKPKDQEHNDGAQNIDIIDKKQVPLDTDSQKKLNNIFGDNSNQQDMQVAPPQVYQRDKQVYPFMKSVKDQQVPIETQEKFNQLMSELRTRLHNNTESLNLALQKTLQLPLQHQKLNTDKPVQQILQNPKNLLNQQPPTHPSQFQFVYLITGFVTGMLVTSLLLSILMKQIKLINNKKSGNKKIRVKDSESQISKETLLNNQHVIESSKQLTDTGSCQNNVFEEIPLHNTNLKSKGRK
eukprot:403344797